MKPAGEFGGERLVDHAMGIDARLAAEGLCDNLYAEMRFALGPRSGMALVAAGLVDYLKLNGRKSLG
jgi:hypothetical protein